MIADKLDTILLNTERVFVAGELKGEVFGLEVGVQNGLIEGRRECAGKHYVQIVEGDGSDTLQFDLPFDPDILYVLSNDPELRALANSVCYVEIDFSALGQLAGKFGGTNNTAGTGSYINLLKAAPAVYSGFFERTADGMATVSGIEVTSGSVGLCYFTKGIKYIVLAAKLDLPSLKTRIESSIALIPDSMKRVYYQAAKVNEAFTDEEWAKLIATKPNCTFSLV